MFGLLHSIKNNLIINFSYHKYWEDQPSDRKVEPLALKEFKNRWYLIARDLHADNLAGSIRTFGLDRIKALDITRTEFKNPKNFNIEDEFRYCFGIISPKDEEPQEVILSFDSIQGKYIKSMPLHESQQILVDNNDELQIKLLLYVTYDFEMELLSYGQYVKVLQPDSLINEMKSRYSNALLQYEIRP